MPTHANALNSSILKAVHVMLKERLHLLKRNVKQLDIVVEVMVSLLHQENVHVVQKVNIIQLVVLAKL